MNQTPPIAQAVKEVLTWFDLFDYPLTPLEAWKFLALPADWTAVAEELTNWEQHKGFYHLPGRQSIVIERQRRANWADRKFKKAKKLALACRWLPWIKLVAVANLIGSGNLKNDGDIDLFIVTSPRRIWLTRLLLAGSLKLLDLRPRLNKNKDTFCLSFLVTDNRLNLSDVRLINDYYFTYWLAGLQIILDKDGTADKLLAANLWLKGVLPNWRPTLPTRRRPLIAFSRKNGWRRLDALEKICQAWQIKRLPGHLSSINNKDTRVVTGEDIIKLHSNDRRAEFAERFRKRLNGL